MPNAGHDGTRNGKRKEGDKGSDNRVVVTRRGVDGRRVGRMTRKNPHRPKRRGGGSSSSSSSSSSSAAAEAEDAAWNALDKHDRRREYKRARKDLDALLGSAAAR
jgi:hypothetical protein